MLDAALKKPKKFVPRVPAAEVIAILINVSYAVKIDAATVVKVFRREKPVDKWDVLLEGLKHIYYQLPKSRQSDRFIKVLADGQIG
jgi:hypothetical protein